MMWPVADFYNEKKTLSSEEVEFADIFEKRGRSDVGELLPKGRKWQRFLFSLSKKMPSDLEELQAMFQGLRAAFLLESEAHGLEFCKVRGERRTTAEIALRKLCHYIS
jgi:hypothetical protein